VGICTQPHGTIAVWLLQALNAVTGRMDEAGGMMFTTPAADVVGVLSRLGQRGALGRWRSAARGLPEFGGELPVATLAEDAQKPDTAAPDRARIRALVTMAGNPVLSAPDGPGIDRTLASLEHVVAIDPYLNETTRHAHVILPPAPPLSRGHYPLPLYAFSVRNVAKYAGPVVPRREHQRHDWEIVSELAVRLLAPRLLRRPLAWLGTRLTPERIVDALLRAGPHGLNLAALRRAPHGLDLGPLQPGQLPRLLRRGAGIDLAPPDFVEAARLALADDPVPPASDQLLLIGRRQALSHNSWMHNLARVMGARHRCALLVHPLDAAARGLARGDLARVESETGGVTVPVEITDTIRPGVVSLPHGWGHHRDGLRLGVAGRHPGVSLNDLTSALRVDGLSGTAAFNGFPVTLRRLTRADLTIDSSAAPLRSTPT
jgi:anaerobic selenocysteine-containing dehydrogenase